MTLRRILWRARPRCGIATLAAQAPAARQQAVAVDGDDIGGVVTGPNGPEAGVWVIAETTDLPTRYIKSVVTDDQGRYLIPDLPRRNYEVWVRGYGLVDSAKVQQRAGQDRQPHGDAGADAQGRRRDLSGDLLVLDAEGAGEARVPGRQRQEPGRMAERRQDQRLLRLSRARQQGDAHHPGDVLRHEVRRRPGRGASCPGRR